MQVSVAFVDQTSFQCYISNSRQHCFPVVVGPSHTHGPGMVLTNWIWKKGATVLGTGQKTNLRLPVGKHTVSLTVVDSGMFDSTEVTTITVNAFGFPFIGSLSPNSGKVAGGSEITISGSGFTSSVDLVVHFGLAEIRGKDIQVINQSTIKVLVPPETVAVPVQVFVESIPLGATSNTLRFTYESVAINWNSQQLMQFDDNPTSGAFGPDGKLYVGTGGGKLAKITLDDNFNIVDSIVSVVSPWRAILGITFDPMSAGDANPPVYFTSSFLFHGESRSSAGKAINGKIQRAGGANLDVVEDIVTGLPVADMDHGVYYLTQLRTYLRKGVLTTSCDYLCL